MFSENKSIHIQALTCLRLCDPFEKAAAAERLYAHSLNGDWQTETDSAVEAIATPGRPPAPELVPLKRLPKRSLGSHEGLAAFVHAIAHIEFNAINLALDAVYRFRSLPRAFYTDWLQVAAEEAQHFRMLNDYLGKCGYTYGSFAAHNGLWDMACRTAHDPLVRMALVPRVLEARGLDVTPGMMARLNAAGQRELVAILELILEEEIGHVTIGTRWFRHLCAQRQLEADETFMQLLLEYAPPKSSAILNKEARLLAGFSNKEINFLQQMSET